MSRTEKPKFRLLEALLEFENSRRIYWWQPASMKRLAEMGLVEAWHPSGKVTKRPAHRLTEAGRDMLAKLQP